MITCSPVILSAAKYLSGDRRFFAALRMTGERRRATSLAISGAYVEAGPGDGLVDKIMGGRGDCEKSKSDNRLPRMGTSSRTVGRGSGRPSVFGSSLWPFRKSSSMNFR